MKKRLTVNQEFEIMKLVLDKFLWLGVGIMAFGLYQIFTNTVEAGIYYIISGAIVLILFMIMIIKEFEYIR
ncbi:MAG: hypothetical protein V1837_00475 [Candidatus Woesearchaeota archaeon]